jgi:hypothetical protein
MVFVTFFDRTNFSSLLRHYQTLSSTHTTASPSITSNNSI